MHKTPFPGIDEAKQNAQLLHRALKFYQLDFVPPRTKEVRAIGLQDTQQAMAIALGCVDWHEMSVVLARGTYQTYLLDSDGQLESNHRYLAEKFSPLLTHEREKEPRILAALWLSSFGCDASRRADAKQRMDGLPKKTEEKWVEFWELELLARGCRFATRYCHDWTEDEWKIFKWRRDVMRAAIVGEPRPRMPHTKLAADVKAEARAFRGSRRNYSWPIPALPAEYGKS
ncbi:hypothetical protein [Cupriavidus metallidurans]|uniref:hypothetical protein n=1 Tax=Cupriavidus metallidurans TaxID=119219 RepID=UPI001CCB6365|nr:hypothetical protein [Cupriavidus metallidurans]UBM09991.1 hypothetical protein LAI70_22210 [Cupriavidus metallidurans]